MRPRRPSNERPEHQLLDDHHARSPRLLDGRRGLFVPRRLRGGRLAELGYPPYFVTVLGAWKVLGALAILAPGAPRLKEWAYAGIMFDLTGAALSHAAIGHPAVKAIAPLAILGIAAASWALRPASPRLGA